MEYIGIIAFILAISSIGLSDKVAKLKAEVRKINILIKGDVKMSEVNTPGVLFYKMNTEVRLAGYEKYYLSKRPFS